MAQFRQPNRELTVRQVRRVEELLPAGHLARFVWAKLMGLDFGPAEALYPSIQGGPGASPFHPGVLMALWVYAMCEGISTAAGIAKACRLRDDFRWLAGGLRPCDQTLLNFVARAKDSDALQWIWLQLLWALQDAGQLDLGAVLEDGTKVRANASPRSFRPAAEITAVIDQLKTQLSAKLEAVGKQPGGPQVDAGGKRELRSLRDRLQRAESAANDLERRRQARGDRPADAPPRREKLAAAGFKLDAERDVLVCPAGESLTFRGTYPTTNRKGTYRLYQRSDCSACPLKASCTDAFGRRVKISQQPAPVAAQPETVSTPPVPSPPKAVEEEPSGGPRASLTDPQAVLMLATSVKSFAPSYNADISVTRQGFIVSQFLTQNPTDYHSFQRALPAVLDALGRLDCWIGDGHYGTLANLVLAHQRHVPLYAPAPGAALPATTTTASEPAPVPPVPDQFHHTAFVHQAEHDVLICPAKQELAFVNAYPPYRGHSAYRLYRRSNCGDCALKAQCTTALGRGVKVPMTSEGGETSADQEATEPSDPSPELADALLREQAKRQAQVGERARKLRGQTSEPVNAQLKLHGLDRLHVRGLRKGSVILTLACIAHNLLKWHTREVAHVERIAA